MFIGDPSYFTGIYLTTVTSPLALDPGCNKTMMVEYATPFRSQLSDAISLGDGSRIAVGHNGYIPWVNKLKENGDVDWSRFYNQHNYSGDVNTTHGFCNG